MSLKKKLIIGLIVAVVGALFYLFMAVILPILRGELSPTVIQKKYQNR